MRVVFAGTPEFSVSALNALHDAGHDIVGVYTQPDRPAGRGRHLTPSPVAQRAEALGLSVFKPLKLRGDIDAQAQLRGLEPDVMVVVAYGLILPQDVLDIPRHGCLNIHASLLPRWRGAAPIQRAILAGDAVSGVTIMQMDAGLDTGPMLLEKSLPITSQTTGGLLHDELSALGSSLIVEALAQLAAGSLRATPQPTEGVTYAAKFGKDDARIDWQRPADEIDRLIRAFDPVPGAWTTLPNGERIKLIQAAPEKLMQASDAAPGTVLQHDNQGLLIATGSPDRVIRVERLQFPGKTPVTAAQSAGRMEAGTVLT